MKKLFKVAALSAVLGFSMNAMASTDNATGTFQWAGTIPASNTGTTTVIVQKGTIAHDAGSLIFKESQPGQHVVTGSSELVFGVQTMNADATPSLVAASSFKYNLNSLSFSAGSGMMKAVTEGEAAEFKIKANDVVLSSTKTNGAGDIRLSVESNNPLTGLNSGDTVVVMATILVTDATI